MDTCCEAGCECGSCALPSTESPITVTINAEARVIAACTASAVKRFEVGAWSDLPFSVINEGFVRGLLAVEALTAKSVEVVLSELNLTGEPRQEGCLKVRFSEAGRVDLTLRFHALGATGGLALKNSVHLLMQADNGTGFAYVVAGEGLGRPADVSPF